MKKLVSKLLVLFILMFTIAGCSSSTEDAYKSSTLKEATEATEETMILATTTSTQDSGLLEAILSDFTNKTGIDVKVVAVGSGKALQMGKDGEADVLLVHAKASEEEFVADGYGTQRYDVMYNDFIVVGPTSDPANLKSLGQNDVVLGFKAIYDTQSKFVSRGDDSGTNKKELDLWNAAGIQLSDEEFYISSGKGMGDVLLMCDEMEAYTLCDRATYLNMMDKLELEIVLEKDDKLFNQYGVIPVNPSINEFINSDAAQSFVEWILSDETQTKIGEYGVAEFGMPLFTPNAK